MKVLFAIAVVSLLAASPAKAGCGKLATVHSKTGATACVSPIAKPLFQKLVNWLDTIGYHIDFMGGWRKHGSCRRCNMHPRGLAIDINQTGRNRVTRRLPAEATRKAASLGLTHGAIWRNADAGHFELRRVR